MHDTSTNTSMRHIENTLIATDPGKERYDATLKELGIREDRKIEEEVRDMGSFADAIERRALNKGIDQGIAQGMDNEKERTTRLFRFLKDSGKTEELEQAMFDSDQRERLYRLYNIT